MAPRTRRKVAAADEPADEPNGAAREIRVTDLHETHANWILEEYGVKVSAEHIALVYKTRTSFRDSEAYAQYLEDKEAEAAEEKPAPRSRGRKAASEEGSEDEISKRRGRRRGAADEASEEEPEDKPAASGRRRSGRRTAATTAEAEEPAPARRRGGRRSVGAATEGEGDTPF